MDFDASSIQFGICVAKTRSMAIHPKETCCVLRCEQPGFATQLTITDDGEPWIIFLCDSHRRHLNKELLTS